jgi:hypothetical protein
MKKWMGYCSMIVLDEYQGKNAKITGGNYNE